MPAPPARAQTDGDWPSVTVVVVNYNGLDYLDRCLGSLRALAYPADDVEVLFIDNASSDGSVAHVRRAFPEVRVIENATNTGFAPAVNQAARLAGGTYLALINNDAEADPSWLRAAVHELEQESAIACVASKILREDRATIDYAGGQMAFYGHGFARDAYLAEAHVADDRNRDTLFASGGAMVVRTETFLEVGGFDDSFFAFFEDVDFGWRLQVLGHRVRFVPGSKVYHRHHGTIERFGFAREAYLLERNALATIFKNYSDEQLARVLPASVLLSVFRGVDDEAHPLPDFRITDGAAPIEELTISGRTGAHLAALRDFALMLDDLTVKRTRIQADRQRDDRDIAKLFEQSLQPNVSRPEFLDAFGQVVRAFELDDHARPRSRVLILTDSTIDAALSGGAARAWEIARLLAHEHEVRLATTERHDRIDPSFMTVRASMSEVDKQLARSDVVISHGLLLDRFPQVVASGVPVVLDVSDPVHLEALARGAGTQAGGTARTAAAEADLASVNRHLKRADLVVCANSKQRDFWLGQLSGLGRVNPSTFDQDSSLRSLLALAPTGVPPEPPQRGAPLLRGVVEGITADTFLLVWHGPAEPWSDPCTLISAVAEVAGDAGDVPDVHLYVADGGPSTAAGRTARDLAAELGVRDGAVTFADAPLPYDDRGRLLGEADVGVALHRGHVEGAFGPTARFLDLLWAGLPVLATHGDALADPVLAHDLGVLVGVSDSAAVASAIRTLRDDPELRARLGANATAHAATLRWEAALEPISGFVRRPRPAADRTGAAARYVVQRNVVVTKPTSYYASRFVEYVRAVGPREALVQARRFVRHRARR
jgi:GT2 family glycosyltransferase